MADFKLGRLKFVWKGTWAGSTQYVKDDIVTYGGNAFVVESAHTSNTDFYTDLDAGRLTKIAGGTEWKNAWQTGTYYKVDDLVKWGGNVYRCNEGHAAQGTLNDDSSKWDTYAEGFDYLSEWTTGTAYKRNDVVKVGGNTYVAVNAHTSSLSFGNDLQNWDLLLEGTNYRSDFVENSDYNTGDIVKYGGNLYIATANHTSGVTLSLASFELYTPGFVHTGEFVGAGVVYKPGQVVRYGGRSYVCTLQYNVDTDRVGQPPRLITPSESQYWELVAPGFNWKGTYSLLEEYILDDVVEYATSSYVCVQKHNTDSVTPVTPGTDSAYWQLMSQGDSNAVMTTRGDIAVRDDTDITRLPLGPAGSYLYSDGTDIKWGSQTPQQDYYVANTGDDSNDGRTPATAWKTLNHAAQQTYNVGQCRINVTSGLYEELCPIKIGRSVVLEGNGLGAVTISPNNSDDLGYGTGISMDGSTPNANSDVFHMNNGARLRNFVFRGFGNGAVCVSLDPGYGPEDTSVWITSQSPYVQNCTSFTPNGTGMKIDGGLHNGGYKSIVANDWTQINSDGIGIHVLNDARSELVSCFTYYCDIGYLAESGAKIRAVVGNNSYGEFGAVARGFSQAETPLTGNIRLTTATVASIQQISNSGSGDDLIINKQIRDDNGNIIIVGYTNPTKTAGDRPAYDNTASEPYIAKYGSDGTLLFQEKFTGLYGQLEDVTILDTQIYAVGQVRETGTDKGFIIKVASGGVEQWQKTINGTSVLKGITNDGTRVYAIGDHNTYGGVVFRMTAGGASIDWATSLDYNDSSVDTLVPTAIDYAGASTQSDANYAQAGDATAEEKIFVASRDEANNAIYISRISPVSGNVETSRYYGQNLYVNDLRVDTGTGDGIYMIVGGYYTNVGFTLSPDALTHSGGINATYNSAASNSSLMSLNTSGNALNQQPDIIRDRKVRGVSSGVTATIVSYDGTNGNDVEITVSNASGSFLNGESIELYQAGVRHPFAMRVNMYGDVAWQHTLRNVDGGEYRGVFSAGGQVYAAGYQIDEVTGDIRRSGLIVSLLSNGTANWQKKFHNTTAFTEFVGASPDGVNVIATGYTEDDSAVYFNTDRDGTGFGQLLQGADFTFADAGNNTNDGTVAEMVIEQIEATNIASAFVDTNLVTDSAPGLANAVEADRSGFAGIGRGITFAIDNTAREPKNGSVLTIENDDQTYFVIDVAEYDPTLQQGTISIDPPIIPTKVPDDNSAITFREAYSQVRMTGHDFLDIGSGGFADTNYPVIIAADYSQQPNQERETLSEDGGRVFYVTTDQDGNFRVGDYFKVDQATGRATLSSEEFDLTGLNELQLGSVRAGKKGATIDEFSTDGTMADQSDSSVPTEKAVVTYVQTQLESGAASASLMKDADTDTTIAVDLTDDGASNEIVFTTNSQTRLTIDSSGQITAANTFTPATDYDLSTKKYVDDALGALSSSSIEDSDGDTKINVEESSDEDIIRFDVGGSEKFILNSTGLQAQGGATFTGNLTGSVTGDVTGTASQANQLTNARTIQVSGAVTGSASFNGSQNVTITTSVNHNHDGDYVNVGGDTMTGTLNTRALIPTANNTYDLGSIANRFRNVYTNDLNLSNGIGDYTVVEGEEDLFLYNNNSGKVFKFALIEVDPKDAPPKMGE